MIGRSTASVLLAFAVVGVAFPAMAEKAAVRDAVGDVFVVSGQSLDPSPDSITPDVVKSVTNHSAKRVKIKLRFVELASGPARAGVYAVIKTNKKNYAFSFIRVKGASRFELTNPRGNKIKCAGKKKKVSAANEVIKISVPRSCLGSPRWVKVGILGVSYVDPDLFADDALRSGSRKNGNVTFGPKLHRA